MIICHKYKFIFVKTRKTAGTSIEIALSKFCDGSDIITTISPEDEPIRKQLGYSGPQNYNIRLIDYTLKDWSRFLFKRKRARFTNHMTAKNIRKRIGEDIWNGYFKFCFERNPWDKALSLYHWRTRELEPKPSICEFLDKVNQNNLSNFGIYSIEEDIAVDHIARYENIDNELSLIAEKAGLPTQLELPNAKGKYRKDKRHYRDIITDNGRSRVENVCSREIEHLGYSF